MDEPTLEIASVVAGTNDVSDGEALPDLLQDVAIEIEQVSADGPYDQRRYYDGLNKYGARAATLPRKGAKIWRSASTKAEGRVMRIYGASEKSGEKSGSGRATIIAGAWQGRQSSVSRRSSANLRE